MNNIYIFKLLTKTGNYLRLPIDEPKVSNSLTFLIKKTSPAVENDDVGHRNIRSCFPVCIVEPLLQHYYVFELRQLVTKREVFLPKKKKGWKE